MSAFERKARSREMIERCPAKRRLAVTRRAVVLDALSVDIGVTRGALCKSDGRGKGLRHMTSLAGDPRMRAQEGKASLRVIDAARTPGVRRVTRRTATQGCVVRIVMTRCARAELEAAEDLAGMTLHARHPLMRAGQRESSIPVIEGLARLLEGHRRGMAARAVHAQSALVGVGVTRRTGGLGGQERPRRVAGRASSGDDGVTAGQGISSVPVVFEMRRVESSDISVGPGMVQMAARALVLHVAVDALASRDPFGDRLVTGETPLCRHSSTCLVAALAVGHAFECGMRTRERSRRKHGAQLTSGAHRRRCE